MRRLRPGWLVSLCGAILAATAFLPWLTDDRGGRANVIGGVVDGLDVVPRRFGAGQLMVLLSATLIVAGAMAARQLSARLASTAALSISLLLMILTAWYYRLYVQTPVSAGYGFYIAVGVTALAVLLSGWSMARAWAESHMRKAPIE